MIDHSSTFQVSLNLKQLVSQDKKIEKTKKTGYTVQGLRLLQFQCITKLPRLQYPRSRKKLGLYLAEVNIQQGQISCQFIYHESVVYAFEEKKGSSFQKISQSARWEKEESCEKYIQYNFTFLKTQAPDKKGQKHGFDWYESTEENKKVF